MTYIQRLIEALEARIWKFIRVVHSANHDYPYHDYIQIAGGDAGVTGSYVVGSKNIDAGGDQSKLFTAKRTNIWTDDPTATVRLNDARNVAIQLEPHLRPATEPYYWAKEFYTNISVIYYTVASAQNMWIYCEGVLPEEARDAE